MPKRVQPLTDLQVSKAKPKDKNFKLADGGGLYLLVTSTGGKLWRFDYRFAGKRKTLAIGSYPEITLAEARTKRDAARKQIAATVDPGEIKRAQKAALVGAGAESFEVVAREWHGKFSNTWSESHARTTLRRMVLDVFPIIGARPIAEVKAPSCWPCFAGLNRGAHLKRRTE